MKLETLAIHAGYSPDPTTKAVAVPIYQTSSFAFDDTQHGADLFDLKVAGNIYSRIMNPTNAVLEERVAALEGGVGALAVASGMAAITYAIQTVAEAGDNIVSVAKLYGGTYNLLAHTLPRFGIQTRFAAHDDIAALEALIDDKTKAVFCESIGNPAGNIVDLAALAAAAHRHGVPLIVDNTVATPILCRPFEHGADIVVHSLTKYIGGHGTSTGGAVAVQCLPDSARPGNPGLAHGAPLRERAEGRSLPAKSSAGGLGKIRWPARSPRARPGATVLRRQTGLDPVLWHRRRPGCRRALYRCAAVSGSFGEYRRCQIAGLPPGLDHPSPAE